MEILTEKDVVIILKERSLMTEAYVIDKYIKLLYRPTIPHSTNSFVEFVLSLYNRNKSDLVKRIDDVISVNYVPAVEYIKRNAK
jgi:hypothetical protein